MILKRGTHPSLPPADLEMAQAFNRFDLIMQAEREGGCSC
jgi:hypothetical protein